MGPHNSPSGKTGRPNGDPYRSSRDGQPANITRERRPGDGSAARGGGLKMPKWNSRPTLIVAATAALILAAVGAANLVTTETAEEDQAVDSKAATITTIIEGVKHDCHLLIPTSLKDFETHGRGDLIIKSAKVDLICFPQ